MLVPFYNANKEVLAFCIFTKDQTFQAMLPVTNPVLYDTGQKYFTRLNSCQSFVSISGGFIKGILRGVRCTKSLRVLFLHRRPTSWTTLVLYSRAVFIFNEPALGVSLSKAGCLLPTNHILRYLLEKEIVQKAAT